MEGCDELTHIPDYAEGGRGQYVGHIVPLRFSCDLQVPQKYS